MSMYNGFKTPETSGCSFVYHTRKGTIEAVCNEDCDENAGGLYVELYRDYDGDSLFGDWFDFMCVHIGDCDLDSKEEVDLFIGEYINENYC